MLTVASKLSNAAAGSYRVSLTATATGYMQTLSIPVTITMPSTFGVTPTSPSVTLKTSASVGTNVTSTHFGGFNSPVSMSLSGLPAGVSAALSQSILPAPGDGTVAVNFSAESTTKTGAYSVLLTASGGGITQTIPIALTVAASQDFTFTTNVSALNILRGGAASVTTSNGNYTGGFNGQITVNILNMPVGMNWAVTGANTANNMVNITYQFTAASYTPTGTHPITITAIGNGGSIVHQAVVQVTVTSPVSSAKR